MANAKQAPKAATPAAPTYKVGNPPASRPNTLNGNAETWAVVAAHITANGPATKAALIAAVQTARGGHGDYVGYAIRRKWLVPA